MLSNKEIQEHKIEEGIAALVAMAHGNSLAGGWWGPEPDDPNVIGTKLCLVHSEVSEATEGYRKGLMDDKLPTRPMAEVELADAVIRIADLAGRLRYDLAGAIIDKMNYNKVREDHKLEHRAKPGGKTF